MRDQYTLHPEPSSRTRGRSTFRRHVLGLCVSSRSCILARRFESSGRRLRGAVENVNVATGTLDFPEPRPSSPTILEAFLVSAAALTNGGAWCASCVQDGGACVFFDGERYQCGCTQDGAGGVYYPAMNTPCTVSARRHPPGPNQAPYTTSKHLRLPPEKKMSRFTTCVIHLLRSAALILRVRISAAEVFDLLACAGSS